MIGVEFLVEVVLSAPPGMAADELASLKAAEARRAAELAAAGHLLRLWRPSGVDGWHNIGLWRARDIDTLWSLLDSLPLGPLMSIEVTPLGPHPNDPGAPRTSP